MTDVSEQIRQQERLSYLAGLLHNTEDGIVALDTGWCITVWNEGAERIYGWKADEVMGRHTRDFIRLDMSDEERAAARRATAKHGRWRGESVAYRRDGTPICVELVVVALRGEHGGVAGYLGIHRDVTDRKRADEALRAAQRRSEAILESITDAFIAVDRDWRYTYVNDRALRQMQGRLGAPLAREDVLGKSMWDVFPDAVGHEIHHRLHQAMREQRVVEFESYNPPGDQWIESHVYPSQDGLSIYYRDVTDRRRVESEREARVRQQALVAELGQRALASDDPQPLLDEAVRLVARQLDVELAEVGELLPGGEELLIRAGTGWDDGVVGRRTEPSGQRSQSGYAIATDAAIVADDLASELRFGSSPVVQEHAAVSAVTVVIRGRDEPFGVLGALSTRGRQFSPSDVSFIQAVANVLATAVERRHAQKRLIEVKEVERRRIARDLHDEALQDVTYALALAARAYVAEPPDELAAALKRVGEQLRGAIYDLRLGGEERTTFPELLRGLVAVHRAMVVDCDIDLEIGDSVPAGPLGATGIEVLRILGEALTNSRRHAGARLVGVRVWEADGTLHAEASDDGHGFDPAGRAIAGDGHGTMGMRERADRLHGHLAISSHLHAGTTVRLEVPLDVDMDRGPEHVRVLLVEDHTAVREAIAAAFGRQAGFDVVGQAASVAEARELLDDVDVAVLDLGLPDGSGADLVKGLHEVSPHAQALVLTAALDPAEIARAIERGAAGVLDKTAHLDEVVDAVRRLRAGETLLPVEEVAELLRFAGRRREHERRDREAIARMTPREREVLQALATGLDSRQIADRLHISIRTERNHVASILAKLGVHSQLQAVLFALRYDIVGVR
jgi:PAS domain S-box-containing protein